MYIHENRLVFQERPSKAPSPASEKAEKKENEKNGAQEDLKKRGGNIADDLADTKTVKPNPIEIAKKNGYDRVREFEGEVAVATKGGSDFLINEKGEKISEEYSEIGYFYDGVAITYDLSGDDEHSIVFMDKKGKEINKTPYWDAQNFSEGKAAVKDNEKGKWHFIDKTGKTLPTGEFNEAYSFNHGVACVRNGQYWKFIKEDGKALNKHTYSRVDDFEKDEDTKEICGHGRRGGVWYKVDLQGKETPVKSYE